MAQKFSNNSDKLRFFIGDVRDRDRLYRALTDVIMWCMRQRWNKFQPQNTTLWSRTDQYPRRAKCHRSCAWCWSLSCSRSFDWQGLQPGKSLRRHYNSARQTICSGECLRRHNAYAFFRSALRQCPGQPWSVIPLFRECAKTGEIPITDERMTRFG